MDGYRVNQALSLIFTATASSSAWGNGDSLTPIRPSDRFIFIHCSKEWSQAIRGSQTKSGDVSPLSRLPKFSNRRHFVILFPT